MMKVSLAVLFLIVSLAFPDSFAYSVEAQGKEKQEKISGELPTEESTQGISPCEERELMFKSNFLNDVERFLQSQLPGTWEGWTNPHYWKKPLLGSLLDRKNMPVDVIERGNDFLIRTELPGVDKDGIHISISDNMVTIEADSGKKKKVEQGSYYLREISRGTCSRTLMLPVRLNSEGARASFNKSILELTIPKMAESQPITIKVE